MAGETGVGGKLKGTSVRPRRVPVASQPFGFGQHVGLLVVVQYGGESRVRPLPPCEAAPLTGRRWLVGVCGCFGRLVHCR